MLNAAQIVVSEHIEHGWHTIEGDAPGCSTQMHYYRFGSDTSKPKIYLQAALHADEQPGTMILHHLVAALTQEAQANQLNARFILFPMVNPLGLQNIAFGRHQGRYEPSIARNHNRAWPNLYEAIADKVKNNLCSNAAENRTTVMQAVEQWLNLQQPLNALDKQRLIAMREAFDAEFILDLHCDEDALNHIYISPSLLPEYQDLANWMQSAATLTAHDSGGGSFDEIWTLLWRQLKQNFPHNPFPPPPLSATLEYRGNFQTFDALNKQDAENLMGFFRGRGLLAGRPAAPAQQAPSALPLHAMQNLRTPYAGLLAYQRELGDKIRTGDVIAEVIDLHGDQAFKKRRPLVAETNGLLFSRRMDKYVWPGCSVAKIAGEQPLVAKDSYLLGD